MTRFKYLKQSIPSDPDM